MRLLRGCYDSLGTSFVSELDLKSFRSSLSVSLWTSPDSTDGSLSLPLLELLDGPPDELSSAPSESRGERSLDSLRVPLDPDAESDVVS